VVTVQLWVQPLVPEALPALVPVLVPARATQARQAEWHN
jgi:hypothetical protein